MEFNPWLGMAIVVGALVTLVAGLRLYQTIYTPHPELVRKLLHIGMGLVAVSFPWLFDRSWPVVVLGVLAIGGMLALRTLKCLSSTVGNVVSGVGRASLGEIYFPLAIAILWHLYLYEYSTDAERKLLYCVPLLLLALADAAAALVGAKYGSRRYATSDGMKSTEGSFAFFVSAFLCVHIPVLLATDDASRISRLDSLLIALLLAWVAMMFEAIAWGGLDNLALPLVTHLLLQIYLGLSEQELALRLLITGIFWVAVLCYQSRTTLKGSAVLGVILVGYICWALGGWPWLVAPLTLFLFYTYLSPRTEMNSRRVHDIHAVVSVASAGLIWLFLFRLHNRPDYLYPFTLAFAAQLAIIGIARLGFDFPHLPGGVLLCICILQGWALLFIPYVLLERSWRSVVFSMAALPAVALAAIGFYFTQPMVRDCPTDTPRWLRQAAFAGIGSALGLMMIFLNSATETHG